MLTKEGEKFMKKSHYFFRSMGTSAADSTRRHALIWM
jgi:hypothetical protein